VDSKAEYLALSSTRSQKKKLKHKQRQCPFDKVYKVPKNYNPVE